MKFSIRLHALCAALLLSSLSIAQSPEHDKMKNAIIDYFLQDREKIHLHLPKKVYSTGEQIWYKGYVQNIKNKLPSNYTSNVYVSLIDAKGTEVTKGLIFSNSGSFSGNIELNNSISSGRYYIRLYTNWMNNFREDHSTTYPITIINQGEKRQPVQKSTDIRNAIIEISPEGGTLLAGVANNVGIRVADCFGVSYQVSEAVLINGNEEVIKKIPLNKFGYGKFELNPNTHEPYTIVATLNGQNARMPLPPAQTRGIAMEINNYAVPNKTIIKLKTSAEQVKTFTDDPLLMIIQQGGMARFFEISFAGGSQEQEISIANDQLYEGTNVIRFINNQSQQIAERLVFKYPQEFKTDIKTGIQTERANKLIKGMSAPNSNLSITVLPEHSEGAVSESILGSFLINSHINRDVYETAYYFDQPSKLKHYELDLLMISQQSKYKWSDIMLGPLPVTHDFDYGLSLKGKVNQTLKDRGKYRIRLYSVRAHLLLVTEINERNEFEFKNLVLGDSAQVTLSLVKLPDLQTPLTGSINASIVNGSRPYLKPFTVNAATCQQEFSEELEDDGFPLISGDYVMLKPVEIESSEGKLTRQHQAGNSLLRGYKITAENNGLTIMNFLNQNGFDAGQERGSVYIFGRSRTTINGQRSMPVIYLDHVRLISLEELWGLQMADVDEIYLNAHAVVPGITNNIGVVRIYRKLNYAKPSISVQDKTTQLTILNGYEKIRPFDNADYIINSNKGYGRYGLIHWIPIILTGEDGLLLEKLPEINLSKIKIQTEGMTPDGKLISETKTLDTTGQ